MIRKTDLEYCSLSSSLGRGRLGHPRKESGSKPLGARRWQLLKRVLLVGGSKGKPGRNPVFAKRPKPRHLRPVLSQLKMRMEPSRMMGPKSRPKAAKRSEAI